MWTCFSVREYRHGACCGFGFELIFVQRGILEAIKIVEKELGTICQNSLHFRQNYFTYTEDSMQKCWEQTNLAYESGIAKLEEFLKYHKVKIFEDYKVIMPNGVDGMICIGCKDWFPYVEPNAPHYTYFCKSCRELVAPKENERRIADPLF